MSTAVARRDDARALATTADVLTALTRPDREATLIALLDGTVPLERFKAVVLHAVNRNEDLQRCTLESVLDAIRVSATLKLEPTGILGEGYLISYGGKAQFEAGYRGLMKLARRSGLVAAMDAQIVYMADPFAIDLGTEPRISHQPTTEGTRGNYRGAYAWARLTMGELVIEWMTDADIQAVRKSSRNGTGTSSPWVNHFGEMARKTVIKRLMKRLPLGTDAEAALTHEAELDAVPAVVRPSRTISAIHERLGIKPAPEPSDEPTVPDEPTPSPASEPPEPNQSPAQTAPSGDGGDSAPSPSPAPCGEFSKTLGKCVREAHEGTNHRNKAGETWA